MKSDQCWSLKFLRISSVRCECMWTTHNLIYHWIHLTAASRQHRLDIERMSVQPFVSNLINIYIKIDRLLSFFLFVFMDLSFLCIIKWQNMLGWTWKFMLITVMRKNKGILVIKKGGDNMWKIYYYKI